MKIRVETGSAELVWESSVRRLSSWCRMILVGIFLWLAGPAGSWAGEKSQDLIEQASSMYGALEFEKSIQLLDQALLLPRNSRQQLIRIYQVQGMCFGYLEQSDKAREAFARMLALDPAHQLSPDVSPRVQKPFQEALNQISRGLVVQLSPPTLVEPGQPLNIVVQLLSDPLGMARSIRIWCRREKSGRTISVRSSVREAGTHTVSIPAAKWQMEKDGGPVTWYAVLEGENQSQLQSFGEAANPLVVEVRGRPSPSLSDSVKKMTPPTNLAGLKVATRKETVLQEKESVIPWYRRWWVWTLIGAAVTTSVVVIALVSHDQSPSGVDFSVDVSTSP